MSLDLQSREKIYARVCELVTRKHFDPGMNGADWAALASTRKDRFCERQRRRVREDKYKNAE